MQTFTLGIKYVQKIKKYEGHVFNLILGKDKVAYLHKNGEHNGEMAITDMIPSKLLIDFSFLIYGLTFLKECGVIEELIFLCG